MALPTPLAYWPFNEGSGTTTADASGNGHTATLVHGTWDTSSLKKFGVAALANTDGGNAGVVTPISLGTTYTIAFWMNGWDGSNDGVIADVYLNSTGVFHGGGTWAHGGLTGSHHLVLSRSGASATLYKDGLALSTSAMTVASTVPALSGVNDGTFPFVGTIDDVRIYDVALTAAQVSELFALNPDPQPPVGSLVRVQTTPQVRAAGSSTVTVTFATPPTLGNAIVVTAVMFYTGGAFTPTCADNFGNVYTRVIQQSTGNGYAVIFACSTITATGVLSVTITGPAGMYFEACAIEVTGTGGALLVDQTISQTGTGAIASTGPTAAVTGPDIFEVAVVTLMANMTAIVVEAAYWTQELENLNYSATVAGEADSRSVGGAAGTFRRCTWTVNPSTAYVAMLAVFKGGTATHASLINVTQDALEVVNQPLLPAISVTQNAVETLSLPIPAIRVTQDALEVLNQTADNFAPDLSSALVSQVVVETLLTQTPPFVNLSQVVLETLVAPVSMQPARLSQVVVEVLLQPVILPPSGAKFVGPWMGGGGLVWTQ